VCSLAVECVLLGTGDAAGATGFPNPADQPLTIECVLLLQNVFSLVGTRDAAGASGRAECVLLL